ncbi:uncharacterized protein LOC126076285 [Elephas maximus indicus]|uniref:uncharacterized protein LOC126076285 n=1 Tax=Elephas maximus indicus TaxID=99487 RepID=UPI00211675FF|nr:uncharacterized protein LOC126076285 [Elephas maximus indicus]
MVLRLLHSLPAPRALPPAGLSALRSTLHLLLGSSPRSACGRTRPGEARVRAQMVRESRPWTCSVEAGKGRPEIPPGVPAGLCLSPHYTSLIFGRTSGPGAKTALAGAHREIPTPHPSEKEKWLLLAEKFPVFQHPGQQQRQRPGHALAFPHFAASLFCPEVSPIYPALCRAVAASGRGARPRTPGGDLGEWSFQKYLSESQEKSLPDQGLPARPSRVCSEPPPGLFSLTALSSART